MLYDSLRKTNKTLSTETINGKVTLEEKERCEELKENSNKIDLKNKLEEQGNDQFRNLPTSLKHKGDLTLPDNTKEEKEGISKTLDIQASGSNLSSTLNAKTTIDELKETEGMYISNCILTIVYVPV